MPPFLFFYLKGDGALYGALLGQAQVGVKESLGQERVLHLDEEAEVVARGLGVLAADGEEAWQVLAEGEHERGGQGLPVESAVGSDVEEVALQKQVLPALRGIATESDVAYFERLILC